MAKSVIERCPKCKKMTAQRDITSKRLICYYVGCGYFEQPKEKRRINCGG